MSQKERVNFCRHSHRLILRCNTHSTGPGGTVEKQATNVETATLAGGCFWGMEDLIHKQPGVLDTEVGYCGATSDDPQLATYKHVKTGKTGHAESIQIRFDSEKTTYADILDFYFRIHDPTTLNRQGNDIGSQYRSAIFPHDSRQAIIAKFMIELVNQSGYWPAPAATTIEPYRAFFKAEDEHQDYLEHYPTGYTCHFLRRPASFLDASARARLEATLQSAK